jgi:hypothetical protein
MGVGPGVLAPIPQQMSEANARNRERTRRRVESPHDRARLVCPKSLSPFAQCPRERRRWGMGEFSKGRAGVRAEWQERQKTLARLQRPAATIAGSRWQSPEIGSRHRHFAGRAAGVGAIPETGPIECLCHRAFRQSHPLRLVRLGTPLGPLRRAAGERKGTRAKRGGGEVAHGTLPMHVVCGACTTSPPRCFATGPFLSPAYAPSQARRRRGRMSRGAR